MRVLLLPAAENVFNNSKLPVTPLLYSISNLSEFVSDDVFQFMMALQLVWVFFKVPETKGVSLEDLEKKLVKE